MATFNKHNVFVGDLGLKVHNLNADLVKVLLTNTAPTAGNSVKANLTEIGAGFGYTAGGASVTPTYSATSGTGTLAGTKVVWTAAGGSIGPFRYVDLYNDTPTSPADPLVGWWDYGAALTLNDGESFSWKPNNSDTTGTIATLA